jgi:nitroreductase
MLVDGKPEAGCHENRTRAELLRTALAGATDDGDWAVVTRLLVERYSCRSFLPERVPHDTIQRILALSQLSASWCNAQPWQVIVTEGEGNQRFREALYAHACSKAALAPDYPFPQRYTGIYDVRRKATAWALYQSIGISWGDRNASNQQTLENFRLFNAPHVMIVTTENDLATYGCIDCGLFVANCMLLMQSVGIASIAQAALACYAPFVRAYFKIPENRRILLAISFGYANETHPANQFQTTRADLQDVVQWRTD